MVSSLICLPVMTFRQGPSHFGVCIFSGQHSGPSVQGVLSARQGSFSFPSKGQVEGLLSIKAVESIIDFLMKVRRGLQIRALAPPSHEVAVLEREDERERGLPNFDGLLIVNSHPTWHGHRIFTGAPTGSLQYVPCPCKRGCNKVVLLRHVSS